MLILENIKILKKCLKILIMLKYKIYLILFFIIFCLAEQVTFAQQTNISEFRYLVDAAKIRLVFKANSEINYTVQQLPDKIKINVKNAKFIGSLKKPDLQKTFIEAINTEQDGKNWNLILEFKKRVKLKHFVLQNPKRLVIDLFADNNDINNNIDELEEKIIEKIRKEQTNNSYKIIPEQIISNPIKPEATRDVVVVIDPGHGGSDPGAIGFRGTREKDVALAISKNLQNEINKIKGFHAVLTRNGDYFIALRERLEIAHRNKADMFIAIHADAYKYRNSHGASIFALSQRGATSEAARWLAEKENESELGHAISDKNEILRSVLIDLAQTATIRASLEIGDSILQELAGISHLHAHRVEQAAFVVLKSPDISSLLVELGFISNPYEESKLRDSRYQQKIAICLTEGVTDFFKRRPPQGSYLAKIKNENKYGAKNED
jgi:N-acetylmuramoyl-L-alanine amidase